MRCGLLTGVFLLAAGMLSGVCVADTVLFTTGEKFVGQLVRIEEGKLVFKSAIAGETTVDLKKVISIDTDRPVAVGLDNGTILQGTRILFQPDGPVPDAASPSAPVIISTRIARARYPVKRKPVWSGNIAAGFTGTNGNSFSEQYNLDVSIMRRSERHRLRLSGLYLAGREESPDDEHAGHKKDKITIEENFTLKGKYDYFFTKKQYGYISGSFKKDHIADLDHRIIASVGAGYQWIDTSSLRLSTDLGLAHLHEKYSTRITDPASDEEAAEASDTDGEQDEDDKKLKTRREVTRNSKFSLQLGSNFEWQLNDKFKLICNLTYNPSISDLSDYYLTSDAEIRLSLTRRMYSSMKAILDYDATPGEDVGSTDTKYILGFGWGF